MQRHPSNTARLVLVACAVGVVAHQATRWGWFIDDAAISFAYARNLATGEGLVPWPGGERVEAYSNPTWTLLLAMFHRLGVDGFTASKPLGMAFAVATLPLVWALTRRALPHAPEPALLAPVLLAINPQLAIWSASGLENGLFAFLLAGGALAVLRDAERGGFGRSAAWFVLLIATRPEGVLYAGIAGALLAAFHHQRGHPWTLAAGFLAATGGALVVFTLARLAYFSWPFPSAYYAKIVARPSDALAWSNRGWEQLLDFGVRLGHLGLLPAYSLAVTGRARAGAGWLVLLWAGVAVITVSAPIAVGTLVVAAVLLPRLGHGSPGHPARVVCWGLAIGGIAFSVHADGDWMGAYRWMSLIAPVTTVLLAVGLAEVLRWRPLGPWLVAAALLWVGWRAARQTYDHVWHNHNETPAMVRQRTLVMRDVARRVFHEGTVVHLDPDLGGHLWWAPDVRQVDLAMLADVPMGRHTFDDRAFLRHYVFEERKPLFAHLHGWWAEHTGLLDYPQWSAYVALPPYPDVGGRPHEGLWLRRAAIFGPAPGAAVATIGPVRVYAPIVPTAWAPGEPGYIELPLGRAGAGPAAVQWFVEQGDQIVAGGELELAYGWVPFEDWAPDEATHGRRVVPVPELPAGRYQLGVRVGDAVARALVEVRLAPREQVHATAREDVREAARLAATGACEAAETAWLHARQGRPLDHAWHGAMRLQVAPPLARCWARRAASTWSSGRRAAVAELVRARSWDHRPAEARSLGAEIARSLARSAADHATAGAWRSAYRAYADAVSVAPWRSDLRRRAEHARDHMLELEPTVP